MIDNFWRDLPRPFFVLAPMEDVTDVVFRHVVSEAARPDVFFTEFANSESYCHPEGNQSVRGRLEGDQVGGALCALNGGDARHAQHISLFGCSRGDELQRGRGHRDAARGARDAAGLALAGHVHHVGLAARVEVGEGVGHRLAPGSFPDWSSFQRCARSTSDCLVPSHCAPCAVCSRFQNGADVLGWTTCSGEMGNGSRR